MRNRTQFLRVLIALTILSALAQVTGAGQSKRPSSVAVLPADASTPAQALYPPELRVDSAERFVASRLQTRRHDARAMTPGNSLSFLPAVTYDSGGSYPASVAVADVNGDGKADLLVANKGTGGAVSGTVSVLLGNGDGTFQAAVSYGCGGSFTTSVVAGDVNGDGKLDLVVTNAGSNTVGVLLGHGDGTFAPAVTFDSGGNFPELAAIADVNGDGRPDIVVVDCSNRFAGCGGGENGTATVLLGNGDGTFRAGASYDAGSGAIWLVVADLNGDGKPDVVVADCGANIFCPTSAPGALSVLMGNGDGTFQTAVTYSSGGISALSVAVADVNGDGKPDLVVANSGSSTVCVLLGNGDGTFQSALACSSAGSIYSQAVVADVNGDSKLDLLVGNYPSTVAALLGDGDGTFQSALTFSSGGSGPTSVAVKDVNGDGKPDVIVANFYSNDVGVLLNDTGLTPTTTALASSANPSLVGQAVTFTATVSSTAGTPPNGELVTFKNGSAVLGTVSLGGGSATLTTSSLPVGTFTITARYPGDSTFTPSTSPGLKQVVNPTTKYVTSTALVSGLNPSIYGQEATFTATVTTTGPLAPTGKVNFRWSGFSIGSATLNSIGVATLSRSNLNADSYPVVAVYSGDGAHLGSSSVVLNQVVKKTTSAATLTSSPNPSTQGQAVTFTAKITSPTVVVRGPVTFTAGQTTLGTAQLSGGVAKLTISSLAVGSTKITATYYGDSNISQSSSSVTQTVH